MEKGVTFDSLTMPVYNETIKFEQKACETRGERMSAKQGKVVHVDAFPDRIINEEVRELEKVNAEVVLTRCKNEDDVIEAAKDADVILCVRVPITRRVMESLKNCKIIIRYGVGVDNIDVEAATDCNIIVTNVPDYCFDEVSNHAIALLLACARKLVILNNSLKQGYREFALAPMVSINGQTLGLVGCGHIGRLTAKKASCFGLRILGFDPYLDEATAKKHEITLMGLPELLRESDFISIHAPLTKETRHMIGENEFKLMKPSAYLINTARGPVIDEAALIKALGEGRIAGAGLDVFEKEPKDMDVDNPLLKMDNVVVTPHSASYSDASHERLRTSVGQEAARVLAGRWPRNVVNRAVKPKIHLLKED